MRRGPHASAVDKRPAGRSRRTLHETEDQEHLRRGRELPGRVGALRLDLHRDRQDHLSRTSRTKSASGGRIIGVAYDAEPLRTIVLRNLAHRGPSGVKLAISGAHVGMNAALASVLFTSWPRRRAHLQRSAPAHAGEGGRRVVSAFIAIAFAQPDHAVDQRRRVADQVRRKLPKPAASMDGVERDLPACMSAFDSRNDGPGRAPREVALHDPHREAEWRHRAALRRRGDLPGRGREPPPGRRDAEGSDRRASRPALLLHDLGEPLACRRRSSRRPPCNARRAIGPALPRPQAVRRLNHLRAHAPEEKPETACGRRPIARSWDHGA
jgi:hypothetical protein